MSGNDFKDNKFALAPKPFLKKIRFAAGILKTCNYLCRVGKSSTRKNMSSEILVSNY